MTDLERDVNRAPLTIILSVVMIAWHFGMIGWLIGSYMIGASE